MTSGQLIPAGTLSGQAALLEALANGRWCTRVELAEETGLVPAVAAELLRELARSELVCPSQTWQRAGQWQITQAGLDQIRACAGEGALA